MNSSDSNLTLNLLPPDKLYCNFNYWSSIFLNDMQILWDTSHGVPLKNLPPKTYENWSIMILRFNPEGMMVGE